MANLNDIELRSEKVRNIIGKIPPLLIRSGITFITTLVVCLLLAAWLIPYPENLKAPITITTPITGTGWQAITRLPYAYVAQVQEGMPVQVELEGYTPRIYGYGRGKIIYVNKDIISQGDKNYFEITITLSILPQHIDMRDGMEGQAFILFSNESILRHILRGIL